MTRKPGDESSARERFAAVAESIADEFGWQSIPFERDQETGRIATITDDRDFERVIWVHDIEREMVRCLVFGKLVTPQPRRQAMFELCARINFGLPFGCLEYVFADDVLMFRDSADFAAKNAELAVKSVTLRALNLGKRYASAIAAVIAGTTPEQAASDAEKS